MRQQWFCRGGDRRRGCYGDRPRRRRGGWLLIFGKKPIQHQFTESFFSPHRFRHVDVARIKVPRCRGNTGHDGRRTTRSGTLGPFRFGWCGHRSSSAGSCRSSGRDDGRCFLRFVDAFHVVGGKDAFLPLIVFRTPPTAIAFKYANDGTFCEREFVLFGGCKVVQHFCTEEFSHLWW